MPMKREVYLDRRKPAFWSIEARPWAVIAIVIAALTSMTANLADWLQNDATQNATLGDMKESKSQMQYVRDREVDALREDQRELRRELRQVPETCAKETRRARPEAQPGGKE